jgi:uncharacterized membrane protein
MIDTGNPLALKPHDSKPSSKRLVALDIVRGYAMLLMLISHSSWWLDDLDYGVAYGWDNMIIPNVSLPESLPGFVLQMATPAFFLLCGFSIALFSISRRIRGWSENRIIQFLLLRGLLLIAFDLTVMNLNWQEPYYASRLSVLTGMGLCVCLMSLLRRLDRRLLVSILALVLIGTQSCYLGLTAVGEWPREESLVRAVLLAPSVEDITWKTQFPVLGWLPVVLSGFIVGSLVAKDGKSLGKLSLQLGLGCVAVFVISILAGDIGSTYPAHPLIFGKHPPDVDYIFLYTGLTFLLIALHSMIERIRAFPSKIIILLGQTALFFYLIHIRLIELVSPLFAPLSLPPLMRSLLIVLTVLPILVVLCLRFRAYKRQHPNSILQYI